MNIQIHGLELAKNSSAKNLVLENFENLPIDLENEAVGKMFFYNNSVYSII